jgi:hypothetical protein
VAVNSNPGIGPLLSLVAGIRIPAMPRLLNYPVAEYLIILGVLRRFGRGQFHLA